MTRILNFVTIFLIAVALVLSYCASQGTAASLKDKVQDYINTYQQRSDWDHFLSFYADSVHMVDTNLAYECKVEKPRLI